MSQSKISRHGSQTHFTDVNLKKSRREQETIEEFMKQQTLKSLGGAKHNMRSIGKEYLKSCLARKGIFSSDQRKALHKSAHAPNPSRKEADLESLGIEELSKDIDTEPKVISDSDSSHPNINIFKISNPGNILGSFDKGKEPSLNISTGELSQRHTIPQKAQNASVHLPGFFASKPLPITANKKIPLSSLKNPPSPKMQVQFQANPTVLSSKPSFAAKKEPSQPGQDKEPKKQPQNSKNGVGFDIQNSSRPYNPTTNIIKSSFVSFAESQPSGKKEPPEYSSEEKDKDDQNTDNLVSNESSSKKGKLDFGENQTQNNQNHCNRGKSEQFAMSDKDLESESLLQTPNSCKEDSEGQNFTLKNKQFLQFNGPNPYNLVNLNVPKEIFKNEGNFTGKSNDQIAQTDSSAKNLFEKHQFSKEVISSGNAYASGSVTARPCLTAKKELELIEEQETPAKSGENTPAGSKNSQMDEPNTVSTLKIETANQIQSIHTIQPLLEKEMSEPIQKPFKEPSLPKTQHKPIQSINDQLLIIDSQHQQMKRKAENSLALQALKSKESKDFESSKKLPSSDPEPQDQDKDKNNRPSQISCLQHSSSLPILNKDSSQTDEKEEQNSKIQTSGQLPPSNELNDSNTSPEERFKRKVANSVKRKLFGSKYRSLNTSSQSLQSL